MDAIDREALDYKDPVDEDLEKDMRDIEEYDRQHMTFNNTLTNLQIYQIWMNHAH